jgi:hypothetical protein
MNRTMINYVTKDVNEYATLSITMNDSITKLSDKPRVQSAGPKRPGSSIYRRPTTSIFEGSIDGFGKDKREDSISFDN